MPRRRIPPIGPALAAVLVLALPVPSLVAQETEDTESEDEIAAALDSLRALPSDPDAIEPDSPDVRRAAGAAEDWLQMADEGRWQEAWASGASALQVTASPQRLSAAIEDGRGSFEPPAVRSLIGFQSILNPANASPGRYVVLRYRARPIAGSVLIESVSTKLEEDVWRVVGYSARTE